jgi:hypothetical protein
MSGQPLTLTEPLRASIPGQLARVMQKHSTDETSPDLPLRTFLTKTRSSI